MKKLLWMLTLVLLPFSLQAQIGEVTTALENNDADALGTYFMNTVELEIESTEGMYAKAQAKVMVRDFFYKNTPRYLYAQAQERQRLVQIHHRRSYQQGAALACDCLFPP